MSAELLQAATVILAAIAGGGGVAYLRARSQNRRDASEALEREAAADEHNSTSAKEMAKAYGLLVDDLREDIRDSREHIRRQDAELAELRTELRSVRDARDVEVSALRGEISGLREELAMLRASHATELAAERDQKAQLQARIATLEAATGGRRASER